MRIGSTDVMRKIDRYAIEEIGIPGIVLMENAALKVLEFVLKYNINGKICIICSKGNNGGDGFAVARHLFLKGKDVSLFLIGGIDGMSNDCRINYEADKKIGIGITDISNAEEIKFLKETIDKSSLIVDAIFGTGLNRKAEGIYELVIDAINKSGLPVISVDVPSGMNSDTGETYNSCVKADLTVTFQLYKKGFFNYNAKKFLGMVEVVDIGIPEIVIEKFHEKEYYLDYSSVKNIIKARDEISHKGDFGRVLIIAGSRGYSGAAYIATLAAVRCGSGLVTLACDDCIQEAMSARFTEAMTCSLNDSKRLDSLILSSDAIAIGPGLGNTERTLNLLLNVFNKAKCPVVIDADALNVLQGRVEFLDNSGCKVVITPHPGEMARLTGYDTEYIQNNRINVSKEFAQKHNLTVLLKGYNTVITDGKELFVNSTGNSSMASGGMGDCLTGMIASFIGQGYKVLESACIAAYTHGYVGEKLSNQMFCVNASHVIENLPYTIQEILFNKTE